jgi:single-stranded DNA-binding protein
VTATITATGNLTASPEVKHLQSGKTITELRIGATRRRNNQGAWEDDGAPLYLSATLFGDKDTWVADTLSKGDTVSLSGDLIRRTYKRQDGTEGESLEIRFPRLLGYVRKADKQRTSPTAPNVGGQNLSFQPPF